MKVLFFSRLKNNHKIYRKEVFLQPPAAYIMKQNLKQNFTSAKKEFLLLALRAGIITFVIELLNRRSLSGAAAFLLHSPAAFIINTSIIFLTLIISWLFGKRMCFAADLLSFIWIVLGAVNFFVRQYRMTPFSAADFHLVSSFFRILKNYLSAGAILLAAAALVTGVSIIVFCWFHAPKRWISGGLPKVISSLCGCFLAVGMIMIMGTTTSAVSQDFMNLTDAYEKNGFVYSFTTSIMDKGIEKPDDYSEETMREISDMLSQDTDDVNVGIYVQPEPVLHTMAADGEEPRQLFSDSENTADAGSSGISANTGGAGNTADADNSGSAGFADSAGNTTDADNSGSTGLADSAGNTTDADNSGSTGFADSAGNIRPNIIMIQLESFFDPELLKGYEYSQDPVPVFRSLKDDPACPSGWLIVPVVGAGTVNTEFEILTGMSTDFFGAGEYPYNTILQETTTEALPHLLRQHGYTSTAIHNNTGTFYHRDTVFSGFGFDRFIPLEYMYDPVYTPNNWVKDAILEDNITDTLDLSGGPDFLYVITVQSHGRYPDEEVLDDPLIRITQLPEQANPNPTEYYINQVYELDLLIGRLIDDLEQRGEPSVLVLYGDHLPALGFTQDGIAQKDLYRTEYVIWNNFGAKFPEISELEAESLSTVVLSALDMADGILPKFHLNFDGTPEYPEKLELLQYDMLYGDGYIFRDYLGADENPYQPSSIQFGLRPVTVSSSSIKNGILTVSGENFNEFSKIMIDGKEKETRYIDRQTLELDGDAPGEYETLEVGQFDENGILLGTAAKL